METLHFALQQLKIRKLLTNYYLAWRLTMTFFRLFIIVFMTSSLGVVVLYWSWYTYYSYDTDTLVYEDQTGTCLVITFIFLLLLLPVCLHYRSVELQLSAGDAHNVDDRDRHRVGDIKRHHHRHHRHRDRSPPPKYHESKFNLIGIRILIFPLIC